NLLEILLRFLSSEFGKYVGSMFDKVMNLQIVDLCVVPCLFDYTEMVCHI
ncbi:unnamed protein product, partial [Rotaria magnacalcarata]